MEAISKKEKPRPSDAEASAAAWDAYFSSPPQNVWAWWNSQSVLAHLGNVVNGEPCATLAEVSVRALRQRFPGSLPFRKGISVGCGTGGKELALLSAGIVRHFTLYELSARALEMAAEKISKAGLEKSISCVLGDAFSLEQGTFDLVFWENSLHHMPDVHAALAWSRARLRPGGVLAMNDFVGPTRFQWTDAQLKACNEVLGAFDLSPVSRPDPEILYRQDPSEAADSGRIKEALFRHFPNAEWIPLGGLLYHMGLTGRHFALPETPFTSGHETK